MFNMFTLELRGGRGYFNMFTLELRGGRGYV